jgi:hypothetical protein
MVGDNIKEKFKYTNFLVSRILPPKEFILKNSPQNIVIALKSNGKIIIGQ